MLQVICSSSDASFFSAAGMPAPTTSSSHNVMRVLAHFIKRERTKLNFSILLQFRSDDKGKNLKGPSSNDYPSDPPTSAVQY
jgi:hypothetical protein